jgi:ribose/xylose/arabinose/galactoside ABC-type transport system permease subunit
LTTPTSSLPQDAKGQRPTSGFFAKLLRVQEMGLVLVILTLGALLTIFGGTKLKPTLVSLQGAAVAETAQGYAIEDPAADVVAKFGKLSAEAKWVGAPAAVSNADGDLAHITLDFLTQNPGDLRLLVARSGKTVTVLGAYTMITQQQDSEGRVSLRVFRPTSKFLDLENIVSVANAASYIAIMAVGMTAIIAMGGIDLSVGAIYGLAAICGAWILNRFGGGENGTLAVSLFLGLITCGVAGALLGAVNGSLIVGLKVHPFIISLGAMSAYKGIMLLITRGQSISSFPPEFTTGFFKLNVGGLYPLPLIVMALVAIAGTVTLRALVFGRHVMAIGGNETAARYAGIPVGRVKIVAYALLGLLAGISACVSIGYFGAASPDSGSGYELKVITAAVIGGASLAGGRGSALGAVLGAIVVQLIDNGMLILQIDQNYTQIVMGVAIVAAVVLDQAKGRLSPGGR